MESTDTTLRQVPRDDDEALRKRLLARVAVAGALVVALLGGLVLFDGLVVRETKTPEKVAAVKPITATEDRADQGKPEPPPAETPPTTAENPEPPAVAAEPEHSEAPTTRVERPLTVPATTRQASLRPSEPVAAPRRPEPAKEIVRVIPPREPQPAPASRPIARAMESARQFVLQMGVFNNVANAEELRAKLELAGVPAHIEARVQVGPFASREEAERAREKLRSLGMEPGMIVAGRK